MDKEFLKKCLIDGMSTRQIEKICNLKRSDISYWINKYNLCEYSAFNKKPIYEFERIDTKEKAYILGFLLGDSSINEKKQIEISVSIKDKCIVEYISNYINGNVNYDYTLDVKSRRFPRARLTKTIKDITKFTGGLKKSERHYPIVRNDLERFMLLGFFDADGCVTWGYRKDKNRLWQKIQIKSQLKILEGVQKYLIKALHISTSIKPVKDEDCYTIEFSNRSDVLTFIKHIYPSKEFIILQRKYLKAEALRLELEDNGESESQYRAEPTEWEGVETSGDIAICLNNRNSIQAAYSSKR